MAVATYNSLQMGALGERVPAFGELDPFGTTNFFSGAYRQEDILMQGIVVTYNPHTHTADVNVIGRQGTWVCYFADEPLSHSFGFSASTPAREGELVLLMRIAPNEDAGIIIGRIPYLWNFSVNGDIYADPDRYHRRLYTQDEKEKLTWDINVNSILTPLVDRHDDSTQICNHFRPSDLFPGEFAHVNQHNCGIKGGLFSATLLGGGANIRVSGISNTARVSCEHYKRFSLLGSYHEFHNGKYVSSERNVAYYQEERLGGTKPQDKVWEGDDSEAPKGGMNQTIRPRIKDFSGFFGHIKSNFCLRPDQNESSVRVQGESTPKEEGVSRETIDPSGQYRLSAAGMLTIERTGRIPVPVRKCYPTDKDHDIKSKPEVLKPFQHDESDPCYRQLELFDRQAYDLKTQYARLDGLGFTPDYDVPQEDELQPLKDKYDEKFNGNETVKLQKFDKRRAGMYIGEDGSVIVRDAWGSEIVMLGGNVTISCAGNVMLLPGKTQLTIAGDDIVQKAQNSVDIHASEHDVRLSAARNMEILGGGDENEHSGGVIIESRGKDTGAWTGKDVGEAARLSGITLRTKNQRVVVDGQKVLLRSRKNMTLLSGEKDIDGEISLGAKDIKARAKSTMVSSGDAGLKISKDEAELLGKTVGLYAGKNLNPIKEGKLLVPLKWADMADIYAIENPSVDQMTSNLEDDFLASDGYDSKALELMMFGFRDSVECGAFEPWSIGAPSEFKMYEPAWAQVCKIYETLKNAGVDTKPYEEKAEWENGKPFPGKEMEDSAQYAKCEPKNLTSDGFNKSRKEVQDSSSVTTVPLKGGYLIRK